MAAMRMPKLAIALVLLVLIALAGTMTYTGFLVIGELADRIGISRFWAGLLLGVLFARFPKISDGKLRTVGLIPKPVRRPLILSLLAFCLASFLLQGEHVSAVFPGLAIAFLLMYPWLRRALVTRFVTSIFQKAAPGERPGPGDDGMVIDGEFTEKKD